MLWKPGRPKARAGTTWRSGRPRGLRWRVCGPLGRRPRRGVLEYRPEGCGKSLSGPTGGRLHPPPFNAPLGPEAQALGRGKSRLAGRRTPAQDWQKMSPAGLSASPLPTGRAGAGS